MNRFNCSVFAFDMTLMSWTNTQLKSGLHFLDIGLADFNSDVSVHIFPFLPHQVTFTASRSLLLAFLASSATQCHFLFPYLWCAALQDTINMTSADEPGQKWETRKAHFRTLDNIRDLLDHTRRPLDVLKLDIEYWEWSVLGGLLSSPSRARVLDDVKQIALEVSSEKIWCQI